MHYIMSFIISVIQNVTTLVSATVGNVKVVFQDKTFCNKVLWDLLDFDSSTEFINNIN